MFSLPWTCTAFNLLGKCHCATNLSMILVAHLCIYPSHDRLRNEGVSFTIFFKPHDSARRLKVARIWSSRAAPCHEVQSLGSTMLVDERTKQVPS